MKADDPALDARLQEIGARLYARVGEAVSLGFAQARIGDWQPSEQACHENVNTWCDHNSGDTPVRGYLYFDLPLLPFVWFNPHSIVRTETGELYDITPSRASQQYPFIIAEESEDEFEKLVADREVWRIEYYP